MDSSSGRGSGVVKRMKQQIALANAQELLANVTSKCFDKCVKRPRESLDTQEQDCIAVCMDRFIDSYRLCGYAYGHRLRREQSGSE